MITLTIQGQSQPDAETRSSTTFDQPEVKIGRDPSCNFVVNDKSISRLHCAILFERGRYYLRDTSKNGVTVNEDVYFAGKNQLYELNDGDRLKMGRSVIALSIRTRSPEFGSGNLGGEAGMNLFGPNGIFPGSESGGRPQTSPLSVDTPPKPYQRDPLRPLFEESPSTGKEHHLTKSFLDDIGLGRVPPVDRFESDRAPAMDEYLPPVKRTAPRPPEPKFSEPPPPRGAPAGSPGASAIPVDWLSDFTPAPEPQPPVMPAPPPPPSGKPMGPIDPFWLDTAPETPTSPPPIPPDLGAALRSETSTLNTEALSKSAPAIPIEALGPTPAQPASAPVGKAAPCQASKAPEPPPSQTADPNSVKAANPPAPAGLSPELRAFLDGAGLTELSIPKADAVTLLRTLGEAYREAILGLAQMTLARRKLKDSLEVNSTRLRLFENNQLKVMSNSKDIMEAMTVSTPPGFLTPTRAIAEAVGDLKSHQVKLAAALPKAIHTLVERVHPDNLENNLANSGFMDNLVPTMRRAKLYDLYEKTFYQVFGDKTGEAQGHIIEALREALDNDV